MSLKYLINDLEDINPSCMEVDDFKRWVEQDDMVEDIAELIVSMGEDFKSLMEGLKELEEEEVSSEI